MWGRPGRLCVHPTIGGYGLVKVENDTMGGFATTLCKGNSPVEHQRLAFFNRITTYHNANKQPYTTYRDANN